MMETEEHSADPVLAISSGFNLRSLELAVDANAVSFEQLYDGSAQKFWADHEDDEPNPFETILAKALSVFERACYLSHAPATAASIQLTDSEGMVEKLWRFWHRRGPVQLACASGVEEILLMFNQTGFNWSFQWQRCFVMKDNVDLIERELAVSEPSDLARNDFQQLWDAGVDAYLVPGVDGASATFFASDKTISDRFSRSLERAIRDQGLPFLNNSKKDQIP